MDTEYLGNIATSVISGTVVGILIGYAVKKVLRIGLVILGTFFAGLAYLQSQGILNVSWNRVEEISTNTLTTLVNSQVTGDQANSVLSSLGLPLTGSMVMGFAIGFRKG